MIVHDVDAGHILSRVVAGHVEACMHCFDVPEAATMVSMLFRLA